MHSGDAILRLRSRLLLVYKTKGGFVFVHYVLLTSPLLLLLTYLDLLFSTIILQYQQRSCESYTNAGSCKERDTWQVWPEEPVLQVFQSSVVSQCPMRNEVASARDQNASSQFRSTVLEME